MGQFMKAMWGGNDYGHNNRCIELPDGSVVKPAEAVKWLEEQDGETDEQTATPRPREEAPAAEEDELLF